MQNSDARIWMLALPLLSLVLETVDIVIQMALTSMFPQVFIIKNTLNQFSKNIRLLVFVVIRKNVEDIRFKISGEQLSE